MRSFLYKSTCCCLLLRFCHLYNLYKSTWDCLTKTSQQAWAKKRLQLRLFSAVLRVLLLESVLGKVRTWHSLSQSQSWESKNITFTFPILLEDPEHQLGKTSLSLFQSYLRIQSISWVTRMARQESVRRTSVRTLKVWLLASACSVFFHFFFFLLAFCYSFFCLPAQCSQRWCQSWSDGHTGTQSEMDRSLQEKLDSLYLTKCWRIGPTNCSCLPIQAVWDE